MIGIFCRVVVFEGYRGKGRFCWVMVVWVGFYGDYVVWVEFGDNEWVGVDWVKVCVCIFRCFGIEIVCELCSLDDWVFVINKWVIWVWCWCCKVYNNCCCVWGFNRGNVFEFGYLCIVIFWVGIIVIGEFYIGRSEIRVVRLF